MRTGVSTQPAAVAQGTPLGLPELSHRLRIAVVSDAIAGRNGVGTYYEDFIEHVVPLVAAAELLSPRGERDRTRETFACPVPGDRTQRLVWPRRRDFETRLQRLNPNVIIIPSLGPWSYAGVRYARSRQIPFVVVCHTNFSRIASLYWPDLLAGPLRWFLSRVNRWLTRQASAVTALGADAYDEARELGLDMERVRIMGTPLAARFISQPICPRASEIRRAVFVGRLAVEKNLNQVLEAAEQMSEMHFVIAGDGPGRRAVERMAARRSNLDYVGWLSRDGVLEELDRSDILLLPSAVESFGTVALEALSRQRFAVVRPECGIARWPSLAQGLFRIESQETLTDSLRRIRGMTEDERRHLAEPGWQAVRTFNDNTMRGWLKFLADAAFPAAPVTEPPPETAR